mmetsp:Transcript_101156/g.200919  ORF Transcript_101156/g.200919 Transcript_101156/m.200919 type:complete len:203 (+) Transcript_101156:63-671(+)|eukprot:CAMPEP_0172693744 /NCGR_PEP_ID=MMETSP1074-20121228/26207_1 /TAXON_ID=2916 /ORGANISM="Ceratium fusus, Strain PA161109" /LENGTH=202 /DNA_ID=CAMNT_0013514163 /DNA_START=52 /DNA_END=660 /DNA_ORIENTATION=-
MDFFKEAPSQKGATQRVWGKLQEAEKSRLATSEKRFGMTWNELHSYKDKMSLPMLPTCMGVEELSTDISLCESVYRGLDRCLDQGMKNENPSQPYARMQICKPHWIRFIKCVKRRDELILRGVRKWEHGYFSALDKNSQEEYTDDIDTKMRYFLYAASHTSDDSKKKRLEMNAQHCAIRQASLLKPREGFDGEGNSTATALV